MTGPNDNLPEAVAESGRPGKTVARVGAAGRPANWRRETGEITERAPQDLDRARPTSTLNYAQALMVRRRRRARRVVAWFVLVVILPTLATAGYYFLVASPTYASEFEITYQTYRSPTSLASGLVQSITGTSQQNTVDLGTIVYEYIRSAALAEKLDASLHLRQQFSNPKIDWFSRLSPTASREKFVQYFRAHVTASEGLGGYLNVSVQTFDPKDAQALAKAVFAACDTMIDQMTARARNNAVDFAQAELTRQETRVRKARLALTAFQNLHGDQDPNRAATQLGTIVGTLESDLSNARAQLEGSMATLSSGSPIITQLKLKISSLEQQLKDQQARLATERTGGETPYSKILDEYSALQQEQDFAKSAYLAAQQGLVLARAGADNRQSYVVDFIPPNLPERMSYAVPLQATGTVFLVSLLVLCVGSLLFGAAGA